MAPIDGDLGALDAELHSKLEALERSIAAREGGVVVAFSGGVDSSVLLAVARRAAENVLAVTIVSELQPSHELEMARLIADQLGAPHETLTVDPLADPSIRANGRDRCYRCKHRIYSTLLELAVDRRLTAVIDGGNVDDQSDYRPGRQALSELGISSPLQDAGLTKADVRRLAKALGLANWSKPAMACLASRIPYGEALTTERLSRVDRAETLLHAVGFEQVRLRDHGTIARIEVSPTAIVALVEPDLRRKLVDALKSEGYTYVAVDLEGYRTGAMNEELER